MLPKTLVILSTGFEEVEGVTVIDILRRAKLEVVTASLSQDRVVMGSHGVPVQADLRLSETDMEAYGVIALPGGLRGVENMLQDEYLMGVIERLKCDERIFAAVCAAPLVLDQCGLLTEGKFTCHPCVHGRLKTPGVRPDSSVIYDNIVTGRSAGCAMDWSLSLVKRILGEVSEDLKLGLRLPEVS